MPGRKAPRKTSTPKGGVRKARPKRAAPKAAPKAGRAMQMYMIAPQPKRAAPKVGGRRISRQDDAAMQAFMQGRLS